MDTTKLMKLTLFLSLATVLLTSCNDPIKSLADSYSYTISGQATIDDTISIVLPNEKGAMQIEKTSSDDKVLLTMNYYTGLNGGVYTTQAKVKDDKITLEPFTRTLSVTYTNTETELLVPVEKTYSENYEVEVSGTGVIYDETIHFTLQYKGEGVSVDKQIEASDILMVAKRN